MPHYFQPDGLELLDLGLRILVILVLSFVIGFEREQKNRPAGLRTHMVVAAASTLIMYLGLDLTKTFPALDPTRLAAQIISGIGFLGAGTIIRSRTHDDVQGLTTAATLWSVAGIGIAVGAGYIWEAALTTAALLIVLKFAGRFERLYSRRHSYIFDADMPGPLDGLLTLQDIIESNGFLLADFAVKGEKRVEGQSVYQIRLRIQTKKSGHRGMEPMDAVSVLENLAMLQNVRTVQLPFGQGKNAPNRKI